MNFLHKSNKWRNFLNLNLNLNIEYSNLNIDFDYVNAKNESLIPIALIVPFNFRNFKQFGKSIIHASYRSILYNTKYFMLTPNKIFMIYLMNK